jgi:hypothetical protein
VLISWIGTFERNVRGRIVERVAEQSLAGRPHEAVDLEQLGGLEDVEGRDQVVVEGGDIGGEGRARDGGQMNHGVDAAVNFVNAGDGLDDLAVVGEIGANETGSAVRGGDAVEVHDRPSLVDERCDHRTAELAAAAGHCHRSSHLFLLGFAALGCLIVDVVGGCQKPAG